MDTNFSEERYQEMLSQLFVRFPSFQKSGASAYKPGIANMEFFDRLAGHPHKNYDIIHVAGTNGKGSVSNMLASALASCGLRVGLYTSPHILDFRERMRVVNCHPDSSVCHPESVEGTSPRCIPKEYVWDFVQQWRDTFDHLDLSFFEITTSMALSWFASEKVDVVVLETGLGGRLDSTNIVTPVLSVITNIGLDHCDMLGHTLPEIAFEKAGIIKPRVPVVVGESHPETDPVFERKVLYTNLPEPEFMGSRTEMMSLLTFADKVEPSLWDSHDDILAEMDLQGVYQRRNLRTVLAALDVLRGIPGISGGRLHAIPLNSGVSRAFQQENCTQCLRNAIIHTASRMDFHGRWEKLFDDPYVICDIGHNEHGLKYNFSQLARMRDSGECSRLIIVYGSVADKDVDAALHLLPENAVLIFTQAESRRALPADAIREKYMSWCSESGRPAGEVHVASDVRQAVSLARTMAEASRQSADDGDVTSCARPLIYIGGSTYVVSEVVPLFQ